MTIYENSQQPSELIGGEMVGIHSGTIDSVVQPMVGKGKLAERFQDGRFMIVAEVYPPGGVDVQPLIKRYEPLRDRVDAVNVSDSPMATPLLSGLATAALFEGAGISAILNITCRDRNSIGLQSELLGAAALGVQAVFCITGDHPSLGDHPDARPVYELNAVQLVSLARQLRDEGMFESGRPLTARPEFLIGAAGSLFKVPLLDQVELTETKVSAGADFIQTPPTFDLNIFREFTRRLLELGVLEQARLIAGIAVVTSVEQALWIQTELPGAMIPNTFVETLNRTPTKEQLAVGLEHAADMISQVRNVPGVGGILLYPYDSDDIDVEAMGRLLEKIGL